MSQVGTSEVANAETDCCWLPCIIQIQQQKLSRAGDAAHLHILPGTFQMKISEVKLTDFERDWSCYWLVCNLSPTKQTVESSLHNNVIIGCCLT